MRQHGWTLAAWGSVVLCWVWLGVLGVRWYVARVRARRVGSVERGAFAVRRHSHDGWERRRHEIGNVLWRNGKRRGKSIPTW